MFGALRCRAAHRLHTLCAVAADEVGEGGCTSTFKYAENSTTSKTSFCFRLCVYMYSSQEPLLQRE